MAANEDAARNRRGAEGIAQSQKNYTLRVLSEARKHIRYGRPILPLAPRDKQPLTLHGFKDSSTDASQVEQWWKQWPDANLGMVCGAASGLVILDVDFRNGGKATLSALTAEYGPLPTTYVVSTGDGEHRYFKFPSPLPSGVLGPGIDLLADGRYAAIPPSIHPNGTEYRVSRHELVAPLPEWLEKLARGSRPSPAQAQEGGTDAPPCASADGQGLAVPPPLDSLRVSKEIKRLINEGKPKGERSEAVFAVTRALVKAGHPDDEITAVLTCSGYGISEKPREQGIAWVQGELRRARTKPDSGSATPILSTMDRTDGTKPGPSGAIVQGLSKVNETYVTDVAANTGAASAATAEKSPAVTEVTKGVPEKKDRPCFRVHDDFLEHGGTKYKPGVWHFGIAKNGDLTQIWVCSPLHVEAVTSDAQSNNFGRLLRFRNTNGNWREFAMPMEMLRGSCEELRGELLAMGVEIDPTSSARNLLATFLQEKPPERRVHCALQVGWCGDSFVLPDMVIGPEASKVIFQSGERSHDEYTQTGTLKGWQREIAARAIGNPMLVLALSAGFAGPLLARCNAEGGGIHLVGDSSTGKSTVLKAACSVWGGPKYCRSWRATANGMEGAAAMFNDSLLALDEISECDPREAGTIVYALANGVGKQRAGRSGSARSVTRWRCFVISSGERTIETAMQEGGHRAKAGQGVRLLDIPAARTHGAWDTLHGFPSGQAFSDTVARAAAQQCGHAGRAFLEKLTRDSRDFCVRLEEIKAEFSSEDSEGQEKRAAAKFAMMALAGEVATEYGLTGWPEGEAVKAAVVGFKAWRSQRGRGNDERRQILEQLGQFIERHRDGRFSDVNVTSDLVRERAGWWELQDGVRIYLFTSNGMREALKGFDFSRALNHLAQAGVLPLANSSGEKSRNRRIGTEQYRVYPVNNAKLHQARFGDSPTSDTANENVGVTPKPMNDNGATAVTPDTLITEQTLRRR